MGRDGANRIQMEMTLWRYGADGERKARQKVEIHPFILPFHTADGEILLGGRL